MSDQKLFNSVVADNLSAATTELQRTKDFSYQGLLKLHANTFKDDPAEYPQDVSAQLRMYGRVRSHDNEDDHGWSKNRPIENYGHSLTVYSNMSPQDIDRADAAINLCRPENMQGLSMDTKMEHLATAYKELDYLHSFGDGNSRVNRAFISKLAEASGVKIDWNQISQTKMYVARDKALAESALSHRSAELACMQMPDGRWVDDILKENLADLNQQFPNVTLKSVVKGISAEIKQEQQNNLITTAAAVTAIEKQIDKEMMMENTLTAKNFIGTQPVVYASASRTTELQQNREAAFTDYAQHIRTMLLDFNNETQAKIVAYVNSPKASIQPVPENLFEDIGKNVETLLQRYETEQIPEPRMEFETNKTLNNTTPEPTPDVNSPDPW